MAEVNTETLAGTASPRTDAPTSEPKTLQPVRFFDGGDTTIPTTLDLRPGVTNAIRDKSPTAVTVNPDGSPAGSPNLMDRAIAAEAAAAEAAVETEEPPVPPAPPAVPGTTAPKVEEVKVPAPD